MVRSWEYARWRRTVMQAVLVAALGVAIALAWWVGRVHAAALNVQLGQPQAFHNRVLNLELRLPVGWKMEPYSEDDAAALDLVEQHPRYGPPRNLRIRVESLTGTPLPTPEYLIESDMAGRVARRKSSIEILGRTGVLYEYGLEEAGMGRLAAPVLYACAVVPGPKPLFVVINLVGPAALAPADIDLLENVAKSLHPEDPLHPVPEISAPVFKLKASHGGRSPLNPPSDNDDSN